MINRLRQGLHWVRALRFSRSGSLNEAMDQIDKMEARGALGPLELAFKSGLLLRQRRFEEAQALIDHVARITEGATNPNDKYVNLWVRSNRAGMNGDVALDNHLVREAEKLGVSDTFREWLPMVD
jgi:hypothetical protein